MPGVPKNNLLMLEVHSRLGSVLPSCVLNREALLPWASKIKKIKCSFVATAGRKERLEVWWGCPCCIFCLDLLLFWWVFCSRMSVSNMTPTPCCGQAGVCLWVAAPAALLWYSCRVTFCRAECCVFWILYIFSNFNVKTQPGCYFWPEAETARRGTLSCSGLWGLLVTVLYSGCEHYSSNWVLGKGISDICSMVEGVTVLLFWFCWVFFVCLGFFWRGVYLLFFWLYFSLLTWSFSSNSKDVEMVLLFVTCRVWKTWLDFLFSYFFCRLFYLLWVFLTNFGVHIFGKNTERMQRHHKLSLHKVLT